ncbi:hypothetical protein ACKU3Z_030100 [Pseudomonas aeruginosa]|nr:hypothetical protein [Pseudomonas aeruginosa]
MTKNERALHGADVGRCSESTSLIEVRDSIDLFLSFPSEERVLRRLRVTQINRLDETHFVLQAGSDDWSFELKNCEGEVCLQVIRAMLKGASLEQNIDKIYFYAKYEGVWSKVTFSSFDVALIERSWPECDSGAALKGASVTSVLRFELSMGITDDKYSSAFGYWWRTLEAITEIYSIYEEDIEGLCGWVSKKVRVGSEVISAYDYVGASYLFAIDKNVLLEKMKRAREIEGFKFSSEIHFAQTGVGWVCYYIHVKESKTEIDVVEPGEIQVDFSEWEEYRARIILCSGVVVDAGEDVFDVELSTEIDMTKSSGGFRKLLKRGAYRFIRVKDSTYDDDVAF